MVPATPGYFSALQIRLVKGRLFTDKDDATHAPVMIMGEQTARRLFGDEDVIGRTMALPASSNGQTTMVTLILVGVIRDVKYAGLAAPPDDAVYRPFAQQPWIALFLVVRTSNDPTSLVSTIRHEVTAADPGIVVSGERTFDALLANATAQPHSRTLLLISHTALTLTMAAVGLYGVVAFSVAQRTREFGIRMALGAEPARVRVMVMWEGVRVSVLGLASDSSVRSGWEARGDSRS
jgi:putative ABC transport system permease protein